MANIMNPATSADPSLPTLDITKYYVVPLVPNDMDANIEPCLYFDANGTPVSPKELDTGTSANYVCLVQSTLQLPAGAKQHLASRNAVLDKDAILFAAIAKTLGDSAALPNTFLATGEPQAGMVILPVAPGTKRGVILVFKKPANGGAEKLVATADPEIKNGSSSPRP